MKPSTVPHATRVDFYGWAAIIALLLVVAGSIPGRVGHDHEGEASVAPIQSSR